MIPSVALSRPTCPVASLYAPPMDGLCFLHYSHFGCRPPSAAGLPPDRGGRIALAEPRVRRYPWRTGSSVNDPESRAGQPLPELVRSCGASTGHSPPDTDLPRLTEVHGIRMNTHPISPGAVP
jgi:hypothetical protein